MEFQSLIARLSQQFNNQLPFVVYRSPNQSRLNAYLQLNDILFSVENFSERGFVFAPFNSEAKTVLIPQAASKHIVSDYKSTNTKVQVEVSVEEQEDEKQQHIQLIKQGVEAIVSGEFEKVVLSRKETVNIKTKTIFQLFEDVLKNYPTAFVYLWYHPKVGLWIGATPETLLSVENNRFSTMALAGTQEYKGNMDVVWGQKEQQEQQIVTDFIVDGLSKTVKSISIGEVNTVKAGNLLHLKTKITGLLKDDLQHVIEILHPTPAVCGLPKEAAKTFILKHENYQRTFYSGFLGTLNLQDSKTRNRNRRNVENNAYATVKTTTNLYVNLRCMEIVDDTATVFVGGGITKDSNPEAEWLETVAKAKVMKRAILI